MSNGHGNSRRQAYGRRMKDLRTRRSDDVTVDLDGPSGWTRGSAWDDEHLIRPVPVDIDQLNSGSRSR
jgi:hypothetical protein